jgi:hypothetical protein
MSSSSSCKSGLGGQHWARINALPPTARATRCRTTGPTSAASVCCAITSGALGRDASRPISSAHSTPGSPARHTLSGDEAMSRETRGLRFSSQRNLPTKRVPIGFASAPRQCGFAQSKDKMCNHVVCWQCHCHWCFKCADFLAVYNHQSNCRGQ